MLSPLAARLNELPVSRSIAVTRLGMREPRCTAPERPSSRATYSRNSVEQLAGRLGCLSANLVVCHDGVEIAASGCQGRDNMLSYSRTETITGHTTRDSRRFSDPITTR
ncbi:hypothetical protein RRG08_053577 [Elysia crispata]|uniref:Uncharacterized protein n=1 Tax=Elysia crispata TaxID=231223 RepID=A0AAE1CQT1_9GAST|nr:hypothetical protein RRG08_053577 [Elysia crispata]